MTKSQIIEMCSILSLISFKSTERSDTKVFFHIRSVVLPIWPKKYVAIIFSTFFFFQQVDYYTSYQLCSNFSYKLYNERKSIK